MAGTYLCACMAAGGEVLLYDAPAGQMEAFLQAAGRMGALIQENEEGLYIQMEDRPKAVGYVETEPYPGFPTDMQSLFLTVCAVAEGESVLKETIFENRFHTLSALKEMGAKIEQEDSRQVRVQGGGKSAWFHGLRHRIAGRSGPCDSRSGSGGFHGGGRRTIYRARL